MARRTLLHNLNVFPARTKRRVRTAHVSAKNASISWGDEIIARIPDDGTAYGRTVRFHESQHLNHTPKKGRKSMWDLRPEVQMGVEDVIIHSERCIPLDLPKSVIRDEQCAALEDLRDVKHYLRFFQEQGKKGTQIDGKLWNKMCITALRSVGILHRNSTPVPDRVQNWVNKSMTESMGTALTQIVANVTSGDIALERLGAKMFEAMLTPPHNPGEFEVPEAYTPPVMPRDWEIENDRPFDWDPGKGSGGDTEDKMPIRELKRSVITMQEKEPVVRHRSSGASPNPFRLARAAFSPITNLFAVRRIRPSGGAFLFDASGSMGITSDRLRQIAERVPAATVAYYSGGERNANAEMDGMVIYAKDGMRYNGNIPKPPGGNDWDHQALQWLLKQKGKLTLVTDEAFTGGKANQAHKAAALLAQYVGRVQLYHSYDELEAAMEAGEV